MFFEDFKSKGDDPDIGILDTLISKDHLLFVVGYGPS
jgi:hypothetical protein